MKKTLFLTLIGLFYLSDSLAKETVLTIEELNCNDMADYCENLNGQPFTGKLSLRVGGGKILHNFKDGRWSGLTTVWDKKGRLQSKTYYKDGRMENGYCYNNGKKQIITPKSGIYEQMSCEVE